MAYRVIKMFKDLKDNGYLYKEGDAYPRSGKKVAKKRLAELASDENRRGEPLIEEVAEEEE